VVAVGRSAAVTVGGGATAAMDRYAAAESRRLQRAVADAERACSGAYMDELLTAVTREMERAVRSSDDQSVSRTVRRRAGRLLELGGSRRAKNQLDSDRLLELQKSHRA